MLLLTSGVITNASQEKMKVFSSGAKEPWKKWTRPRGQILCIRGAGETCYVYDWTVPSSCLDDCLVTDRSQVELTRKDP